MSFELNSDITRMYIGYQLFDTTQKISNIFNSLSSGLGVYDSGSYAANISLSSTLSVKIKELYQNNDNIQTSVNLTQVTDGALSSIQDNLGRINELAVKASSDFLSQSERDSIQLEIDQLVENIDKTASGTTFSEKKTLDGSAEGMDFPIDSRNSVKSKDAFKDASSVALGLVNTDISSSESARKLMDESVDAKNEVIKRRAEIGSIQDSLVDYTDRNQVAIQNLVSAHSTVINTDIAQMMVMKAQLDILKSLQTSLLVQANHSPNIAIDLL